jgi:hypothetical protein
MTTFRKTVVYIRLPLYSLFHPRGIIRLLLDETGCIFRAVHSGGAGRAIAAPFKKLYFRFL